MEKRQLRTVPSAAPARSWPPTASMAFGAPWASFSSARHRTKRQALALPRTATGACMRAQDCQCHLAMGAVMDL